MTTADALWIGLATAGLGLLGAVLTLAAKAIEFLTVRRRAREEKLAPPAAEDVEADAAPDADAGSLPWPHPAFVNRVDELATAEERIRSGREAVLVFEGERGIGKSAAAVQLAHRLLKRPPDDVMDLRQHEFIWVKGRKDNDGRTTLADIGRSLSIETQDQSVSTGSDEVKLERLRRHLADRKTALVLDSLKLGDDRESEDLLELLGTVPNGSLVIATVNREDDLDAFRVPLKELDVDDVYDLVAAQAERLDLRPRERFDRAFAKRLHGIVGGHPSTITWFLRACRGGGESLDQRLEALSSGRGLERFFAPIWRSLEAGERAVLVACDCLGGRSTVPQLAVACGISEKGALRSARKLYGEGLLSAAHSAGHPSYVCSQALGLFVAGQVPLRDRYRCWQRLARHYLDVLGADPEDARALLPEVDALRAVFAGLGRQQADGIEDPRLEADLQELFRATLDVLLTLGLFEDRIAAGWYAYESAMRTGNYRCASLAGEVLASTYALRSDFEGAESALQHGRIAAGEAESAAEVARQMYSEGFLRYRKEEVEVALKAVSGAEDLAASENDRETLINVLDMRAAAHLYLGEVDACEAASQRCLAVCEEIAWERAKSFPLRFLAEVAIHRGRSEEAGEILDRARELATRYHDQRQYARILLTTARMHLYDRDLPAAESAASEAVAEAVRLGLPPEEEEARALEEASRLARRSPALLDDYAAKRPVRLTPAPVAGD